MENRQKSLCLFYKVVLILAIIGPITTLATGCATKKNQLNALSKRDYLPNFYSSNFVFSDSGSQSPNQFIRDQWPSSPEALRAVKPKYTRTYTYSNYSSHTNSRGRLHQNFSYRIVTNSVK